MVRLRTIFYTQTIIEILNWLASHTTTDLRAIASLAIKVAAKTFVSNLIRVGPKRAIRDAIWSIPLFLLVNNNVSHIEWSKARTRRIAFSTFSKERTIILTNDTILVCDSLTELASGMTANITNLNVFVPFRSYMREHSVLILFASHKLNISI